MTHQLTLGPVLYHWSPEDLLDFYARIADEAPVGTVYLGEVICSKRSPFFDSHIPGVIDRLQRASKTVVLSSLAEVVLKRERDMTRDLCAMTEPEIEINNASGLFPIPGRANRVGPMRNVCNGQAQAVLAAGGATHFALPVEMPGPVVGRMAEAAAELGRTVEVQVFGRASLAVSARCYHARAHRRTKDSCQFVCADDPDGMPLTTVTGQPFLTVNGIQTQSHSYVNLADEMDEMGRMKVTHFRLSPQRVDMVAVARIFADRLAGRTDGEEAVARLDALKLPAPLSNGFWHGREGGRQFGPRAL